MYFCFSLFSLLIQVSKGLCAYFLLILKPFFSNLNFNGVKLYKYKKKMLNHYVTGPLPNVNLVVAHNVPQFVGPLEAIVHGGKSEKTLF